MGGSRKVLRSSSGEVDKAKKETKKRGEGTSKSAEPKIVPQEYEYADEVRSRQRIKDIICNNGLFNSALSKEDLKRTEDEMRKYWGQESDGDEGDIFGVKRDKPQKSKGTKRTSDTGDEESASSSKKHVVESVPVDVQNSDSDDNEELFRMADKFIEEAGKLSTKSKHRHSSSRHRSKSREKSLERKENKSKSKRGGRKHKPSTATAVSNVSVLNGDDPIVLSSDPEEENIFIPVRRARRQRQRKHADNKSSKNKEHKPKKTNKKVEKPKDDSDSPIHVLDSDNDPVIEEDLGRMLIFYIELEGQKQSIHMYEKQYCRDLRDIVSSKFKTPPETLQMFLGEIYQLEDDKTLKDYGFTLCCTVDCYVLQKSEKELYEEGCRVILRFKIQTSDRRGRQDSYVYVSKRSTMQTAIDQYSKEMGINPSKLKLRFDGEDIDLSETPENCDLEGDECLDLIVLS